MSATRFLSLPFLVVSAFFFSQAQADDLKTLAGKTVTGTLAAITDNDIEVKTKEGAVKTPVAQALLLDLRTVREPAGAKFTEVRLLDESFFRAAKVVYKGKTLELTLLTGAVVEVPFNSLVSLVHDLPTADLRKSWDKIVAEKAKRDRLVGLQNNDLKALDGTFGEVNVKEQKIAFRFETGKDYEFPLDNLHGLIFFRTEVLQETPLCKVIDTLGNTVTAAKLAFDGKLYTLTTTYKTKIAFKTDEVAKVDFNFGKLHYLSDLAPERVVEKSGAGLVAKYKKDANLDGEPIVLEKPHAKGLSMHAYTELEYNLRGKYKEFKAIAGVDKRTGDQSQAVLTIYCDGDKRFSQTITARETKTIGINVKDVSVLKIVVSSRNFLDLHDHVTLAEARVSQ